MTTFDTKHNHRTYDADTHKVVPKDAVVLDLSDVDAILYRPTDAPAWLREVARAAGKHYDTVAISTTPAPNMELVRWIADQIEAQTKPPHIPEPGWGAVVEAHVMFNSDRLRWVKFHSDPTRTWSCEEAEEYERTWDELLEPVLIRPGIEDAHCEGHGGPGRWYCCQHPDAGWPCPETVEDQS